jgi:hypothetical protein
MRGITGVMMKVEVWGSLQGLTGLALTREFIGRSHWTTHTSKTINLIYSPTTLHDVTIVTTEAAHWSLGTLTNSLTTIAILLLSLFLLFALLVLCYSHYYIITTILTAQWMLASPYILVPLDDVTLPELSAARSFVNLLHCLHVKNVLEVSLVWLGDG